MRKKISVFCVIGKSGSGKGTQVELLKEKIKKLLHIYSGDLLRAFVKSSHPLAKKIGLMIDKGNLAPDWITDYLWQKELLDNRKKISGVVFEGTPRTVSQAKILDDACQTMFDVLPIAIYLDISDKEAKKRLLKRLVCKKCKLPVPYKLLDLNPKTCSFCGGPIIKREDDNTKSILERLKFFRDDVMPAIDWYKERKRLIHVNGEQDEPEVFKELWDKLKRRF
jgi:adenylate kinase